ncbi:acyl-CoA dehydrogenase [Frigidibacter sp. MR17.14]|uniref:acyl-CoA dehydrogenase n=1 Tax=Frigidibacter sp. MR17.14 TaxID=3126509 RepID=UPI0030131417
MPGYVPPLEAIRFTLRAVTPADTPIPLLPDEATLEAILDGAGRLAAEALAPLNPIGDREGCVLENGTVRTPAGFRDGFDAMRDGGWCGLDCAEDHGGAGLSYLIHSTVGEIFVSANMALQMYAGLTHGAYSAILAHGSEAQKALYLPKLANCAWTGTMNLTEPQAGTDLGLIRTKAEPAEDGSYRLTGQKIFISAGEHDLAENIVHLVLARAPGGEPGTRGLSMFIVPKHLPEEDGTPGARNAVHCLKVEEKMGIHGNATCVMAYDGATGWLIGELHKGMRAMFTMMNEARLGVGLQGYAVAEAAAQAAAAYARDRLQGRSPLPGPHEGAADPLIAHPDIRRMLMDQRAFLEGARALTYWGAAQIDLARTGDAEAEARISLLTPVIKAFLTDRGFETAVTAQQVFGGHGYIEETGVAQYLRDARIAMIYEGANGVQALDLVGRKLAGDGGRAMMAFFATMKAEIAAATEPELQGIAQALKAGSKDLQAAAMHFAEHGLKEPAVALAGASDFLSLFGHVALGWMHLKLARAALDDAGRRERQLALAEHWAGRHMPATALHLARIRAGAASVMALPAEAF